MEKFIDDIAVQQNREVIIIGESFGGLLTPAVAMRMEGLAERQNIPNPIKGLVMINPATSYEESDWTTLGPLLTSLRYLEKKDGEKLKSGTDIAIDYQGYFLDGTEFDNSTLGDATLYFQFGKPEQVIRGFEIVLSKMKEGERVRAYIPSHLAFGSKGSTTGIVKEHTPLYFDLHLKEVYKKENL